MKVSVNDEKLFELNDIQKKVIMNDIPEEIFHEDMCRRLEYILTHKYERCFERLKAEWEPKLSKRMASLPTNPEAFAELVFIQPDYKNRSQRDKA
jgi:hypothetical protein